MWRRMALALSLVYAWLTMFRPKGSERESGVTFCCCWVDAHWIAPVVLQTPPRPRQRDRGLCACSPPSTICYPTAEPPRTGPEEGELGVLDGAKEARKRT